MLRKISFNKIYLIYGRKAVVFSYLLFSCLLLVLSVISEIANHEEYSNVFFCSDTLYLPSIYRDVFIEKNTFEGWHFNAAPNFFPDMIVYFLLMFLLKNFVYASLCFSVIQYFTIVLLLYKIVELALPGFSILYVYLINIILSFFLFEALFFSKDFTYSFYILSNAYHTGSFVATILCLYLVLLYLRKSKVAIVLLFVFMALSTLSDRLFVISFVGPFILVILFFIRKIPGAKLFYLLASGILAPLLGLMLFTKLSESGYVYIDKPQSMFNFSEIQLSVATFINQMYFYIVRIGFRQATLILYLTGVILMVVLLRLLRKNENVILKLCCMFLLASGILTITAPLINGSYTSNDTLRYNIHSLYMSPVFFAISFAFLIKNDTLKMVGRVLTHCAMITLVLVCIYKFDMLKVKQFISYYPDTAKQLDSIASDEGLVYGIAEYWAAKKTTMFSKRGVKLFSVYDDVAMYPHVANEKRYFEKQFTFVLLNNFKDTTFTRKRLIPEKLITKGEKFMLYKVRPFIYRTGSGPLPVNLNKE